MPKKQEQPIQEVGTTYSIKELKKSKQFTGVEKDFLSAFLNEKLEYTVEQAKEILNKNLKKGVK